MSLFELTCIVTGGNYNTRWWCWALAWVLAIMIIFYCVMIIISLFISMTNYDMANERITEDIANNKVDDTTDNINANNYAKNIMNTYEQDLNNQSQYSRNSSSMPSQEYQPPVPPTQQPSIPQQSQHMSSAPASRSAPASNGYTGFDASDNYAPLDASFVPVKQPMRQQPQRANGNSDPRTNETVEPYMNEENEQFAPY